MNYKQRADKEKNMLAQPVIWSCTGSHVVIPPVMTGDERPDASQKGWGSGESATGVYHLVKKRSRQSIMTPVLATVVARTKLSDRKSQTLCHDVQDYTINMSSVQCQR